LEFKDGLLNGYLYWSSFAEDKTHAHLSNINKLRIRESTKNDAMLLLGKPHGKFLCPTTFAHVKVKCDKASEIWFWNELRTDNMRRIVVSYDQDGKVIDIETTGPL
jgi:hypothetical protein